MDDIVVGGVVQVEKDADLVAAARQSENVARGTYWTCFIAFHMAITTLYTVSPN